MEPAYEYRGLVAQTWDILRGDTSHWSDRFFYLEIIRRYGEPALDIGCGTGRLLLDYLSQGIVIEGVDNSPEMLALCRQKAARLGLEVTLYEQHLERLSLPRRYGTILIPSSTLQLLTEPQAALEALRRVRAHLTAEGAVAASIMTLWQTGEPLYSETKRTATRPEDGALVRHIAKAWYDPATECESTEDLYQIISPDGQILAEELHRRSPATRSYTQDQARALFAQAGFSRITLYSQFTFSPAQPTDRLFTVVAQ